MKNIMFKNDQISITRGAANLDFLADDINNDE